MQIDDVMIDYGIIDQTILKDKDTITATDKTSICKLTDVENNRVDVDKLAYLEQDYILLDGSYQWEEDDAGYDVGYESETISDEQGNIDVSLTFDFTQTHVTYGVQLYFDPYTVAKSFDISYYQYDTLLGKTEVRGNTEYNFINYDANLNWNKIVVRFLKINPRQRARLSEIMWGVNERYTSDVLISASASSVADIAGDYNNCGEFSFTFFNTHLDFSSVKGLTLGLMEWLRTTVWIKRDGIDEWEQFGEYFSEASDVEQSGDVATISGYDVLYRLGQSTYRKGIVYDDGRSLADWAREVAEDAGIDIIIDSAFETLISKGYITEVPHREALRLIAEAGAGVLTVEPTGEVRLKKLNIVNRGALTDDEIVEDTLVINSDEKNLGTTVDKYTYVKAKDDIELGYIEEIGLTSEPQLIEITYSTFPVLVSSVQVFVDTANTNAKIEDKHVYSDRITLYISNVPTEDKPQETTFVTITGLPYNQAITTLSSGSTVKNVKEIKNNTLITDELANIVLDYQHQRIERKYQYSMEVFTDKTFNFGDRYDVQGNKVIITGKSFALTSDTHTVNILGID